MPRIVLGLHRVADVRADIRRDGKSWPAPGRFRAPGSVLAGVPATIGVWPRRARIRPSVASVSKARRMDAGAHAPGRRSAR